MPVGAVGLSLLVLLTLPPQLGREYPPLSPPLVEELIVFQEQQQDLTFHSGEWDKTAAAMDRLIILDGNENYDRYAMAAWLQWTRNDVRVKAYYQRMLYAHADDPDAWYEISQYYFINRRDYAEAEKYLRTAVAIGLPAPKNHFLGFALKKQKKDAEARAFWQSLLKKYPDDETAKRELGME